MQNMRLKNTIIKTIISFLVCSVLGFLLVTLVFCIPTESIDQHVRESAVVFKIEGTYPKIKSLPLMKSTNRLDNFTDAVMLLGAVGRNDRPLIDRTINVYRRSIKGKNPCESLVAHYIDNEKNSFFGSYGRYWHGYMIYLKPLLFFMNYQQIRMLNVVIVSILIFAVCWLMWRREMKQYILPYLLAILFICPYSIALSLQYSAIFYVFSIANIVLLSKRTWFEESDERLIVFFVIVGCATSFFDFLTYPFATLGIPLAIYLCWGKYRAKEMAKILVLCGIAWSLGYVGMWASKWIWGTVLGNQGLIKNAFSAIKNRTSNHTSRNVFTYCDVVKRNFSMTPLPTLFMVQLYTLFVACFVWIKKGHKMFDDFLWIFFLGIAIMPFVWYLGASNHSYVHAWMTWREFVITAFALMCFVTRYAFGSQTSGTADAPESKKIQVKKFLLLFVPLEAVMLAGFILVSRPKPVPSKVDYQTARLDIKLTGENAGLVLHEILNGKASAAVPAWFQKGGKGYIVESIDGKIKLLFKAETDGKLNINLRGRDVRDRKDRKKRIPVWIDYTSFKFNGKEELAKITSVWIEKPKNLSYQVKKGDTITIEAAWQPHK